MLDTVLLITAIGMGLVFAALVLLWGSMELLVRLTQGKQTAAGEAAADTAAEAFPETTGDPLIASTVADKKRIAAVAVAAALSLRRKQAAVVAVRQALDAQVQPSGQPAPPENRSNWQPVQRAARMEARQRLFARDSRRSSS